MRVDSKEHTVLGWANVSDAAPVVVHGGAASAAYDALAGVASEGAEPAESRTSARNWLRTGIRVVRNASIALALLIAVPIVTVARNDGKLFTSNPSTLSDRLEQFERFRALEAPTDPSISPIQAGMALHALQPVKASEGLTLRSVEAMAERPWKQVTLEPATFAELQPGLNLPTPSAVFAAAREGLTPAQLAHLRVIAEAQVWEHFDMVAAAPQVDAIGGQYELPFASDALAYEMSRPTYSATRELALASVSRAAYYLAAGETARAEHTLRSVVSFGFALIDNATNAMDALIGGAVVDIGRSGMEQFYLVSEIPIPEGVDVAKVTRSSGTTPRRFVQQELIDAAGDARLSRGLRLESLRSLSLSTCTNVRELLFGPGVAVREAFASAEQDLARFESERAYLLLLYESPGRIPERWLSSYLPGRLVMGAATVAGTVLRNPRVTSCTRVALLDG